MIGKIIVIICLISLYVIGINQVPDMITEQVNISENEEKVSSGVVEISFSGSVDVSVKRPRFYGTIYESSDYSFVNVLNIIPIPLKKFDFNFKIIHQTFILIIVIISFISILTELKGGKRKMMKPWLKTFLISLGIGILFLLISVGDWGSCVLLVFLFNYLENIRRKG